MIFNKTRKYFAIIVASLAETWQNAVGSSQIIQKILPNAESLKKTARTFDKSKMWSRVELDLNYIWVKFKLESELNKIRPNSELDQT